MSLVTARRWTSPRSGPWSPFALGLVLMIGGCRRPPTTEEDACRASEDCKRYGLCHHVSGPKPTLTRCVALRAEDCWRSERCATDGVCGIGEGFDCQVTPLGCKRSKACKAEGRCRFQRRSHREHPLSSLACVPGATEEPDPPSSSEGCRAPDGACANHGACSLDPATRTCVAMTDQDCAGSRSCRDYGSCVIYPGGTFCTEPLAPRRDD